MFYGVLSKKLDQEFKKSMNEEGSKQKIDILLETISFGSLFIHTTPN